MMTVTRWVEDNSGVKQYIAIVRYSYAKFFRANFISEHDLDCGS